MSLNSHLNPQCKRCKHHEVTGQGVACRCPLLSTYSPGLKGPCAHFRVKIPETIKSWAKKLKTSGNEILEYLDYI